MSKRYIFLAMILLGAAFVLMIIPEKEKSNQVDPELFLVEINDQARFLDTDLIAKRIIDADPSLFLIDVRSLYEYEEYALPGAVNIPVEELLLSQWEDYFSQDAIDVVFYSNSDVYADQAWALCAQLGYENLYVMKGGLNIWFKTIMMPEMPTEGSPSEYFDLYSFRKGASLYFGGSVPDVAVAVEKSAGESKSAPAAKKTVVVKKKVKKQAEGGC